MRPVPRLRPQTGYFRALRLVSLALLLTTAGLRASAEEPRVTITGGVQEDGGYQWVVTNYHKSPIVWLEFPHYHADMFMTPPEWSKKTVNLVGVGADMARGGTCTAYVDEPRDGIPRFGRATFGMRIATAGARTGKGSVVVGFADGSSLTVQGVDLPVTPAAIERFAGLIGFAILIVIIILVKARRQRSRRAATSPTIDTLTDEV